MNNVDSDSLLQEANSLLPTFLELAKTQRASAFTIAAIAVIKAFVETHPDLAPWVGGVLANEGMAMLETSHHQAAAGAQAVPMPTTSIH